MLTAHLIVVAACLLTQVTAAPAFAGGLANPVVPAAASGFNAPPPENNETTFQPSDADCPATDGTIPLYLPDPDSCTKYTVCSGGFGQKMECPPGMHFSAATSSCTYPALANCPLLENVTETISFTDLKGPPGIDATAYPNVGLTGLPLFENPAKGIGQLPDKVPADPSLSTEPEMTTDERVVSDDGVDVATDPQPEPEMSTTEPGLISKLRRNKFTKITI